MECLRPAGQFTRNDKECDLRERRKKRVKAVQNTAYKAGDSLNIIRPEGHCTLHITVQPFTSISPGARRPDGQLQPIVAKKLVRGFMWKRAAGL